MATTRPGANASKDPFYSVKEKVETSWPTISSRFEQWQHLQVSASSPDLPRLTKQIKEGIRAVIVDLNDLDQTIKIVEQNRAKFAHIDERELNSRKKFVSEMKEHVRIVKDAVTSAKAARQSEQGIRAALVSKPIRTTRGGDEYDQLGSTDRAVNADNDDHIASQRQQQQVIESQQDEVLVDMEHALHNLTGMADDINKDLHEHGAMISELDENLDTANSTMVMVNKKLTKLLGTSDKGRLCCIFLLLLVIIGLFIGIIYG